MLLNKRINRRKLPEVFQSETAECGLACLVMVANYHKIDLTLAELRDNFSISLKGLNLQDLIKIASTLGLEARPTRRELNDLKNLDCPALLHWDMQHFVVLKACNDKFLEIHDPSIGYQRIARSEASKHFTGIAVEFKRTANVKVQKMRKRKFGASNLIAFMKGMKSGLFQVLAVSAMIEALLLLQPVFIRSILDEQILYSATGVYQLIAWFSLNVILFSLMSYFRDHAAINVGTKFNFTAVKSVFSHMLSIKSPFFEKRSMGDLLERYRVMDEIESVVVSIIPFTILDGTMTIASLVLLFIISPEIAFVLLCCFIFLLFVRMYSYKFIKRREKAHLHIKGEESGYVIETLKNIFTTKVNNLEARRFNVWQGFYSSLIKSQKGLSLSDAKFRNFRLFTSGMTLALILFLVANDVVNASIDFAVVVAILFYFSHFTVRSSAFIDRLYELRKLGLRIDRLADIMLASVDSEVQKSVSQIDVAKGDKKDESDKVLDFELTKIETERLSFKYGTLEPEILSDVNFEFNKGQYVALIGNNGAGKTTLLKLLLGLYEPNDGKILYNGLDQLESGYPTIRDRIAVVMQNDTFYTGTVAQNISNFDIKLDIERVIESSKLAGIHNSIDCNPMGYNTRMGDMGVAFSAGQIQKIYLARALYRRPDFLFMDEGTANLDSDSEINLLNRLKRLPCGKLMIAHRESSIEMADRVLLLENGVLRQV